MAWNRMWAVGMEILLALQCGEAAEGGESTEGALSLSWTPDLRSASQDHLAPPHIWLLPPSLPPSAHSGYSLISSFPDHSPMLETEGSQ